MTAHLVDAAGEEPPADPGDLAQLIEGLRRMTAGGLPLPPERALAATLQVSRHQLRRAIAAVRAAGILPMARRPGRPSRRRGEGLVNSTSPLEVIEVRLVLEPPLAEYAALRASPREVAAIERAASTAPGTDTGVADRVFHAAIAAAAHNALAADLYALLRQVGSDARLRVGQSGPLSSERVRRRDDEHRAIAAAIAARDPTGAEAAMRDHLLSVERQVRSRLTRKDAAGLEGF